MNALVARTRSLFQNTFGFSPVLSVQAPGRVNLIGEHTDYNDGFVLPCAIDYQTVICASPRDDNIVRVIAADYQNQQDSFSLTQPIEPHAESMRANFIWTSYVRGVVLYLQQRSPGFNGADLVISGNVPQGAGLSSSASLEVAVGKAFQSLYQLPLDGTALALNGQQAENQFVGCQCGIMDQLISALGEKGHALLIDCRSLQTRAVPMPAEMAVMIINSNVKRGLVGSEYNVRREQCETAARFFGVKALRDVTLEQLISAQSQLDPVVFRRARHVITENARTLAAADALTKSDWVTMGQLMALSHASMRDDFEITIPAIDALVEIVKDVIGEAGGVRMTGGGFGGCVVALLPESNVDAVRRAVSEQYHSRTGMTETIYLCKASAGASLC